MFNFSTNIRPNIINDGGDIQFIEYKDDIGEVTVKVCFYIIHISY